ncbi:MAG TPA: ferredoxin reductase [Alcanivorax sp.]|nr:ferredoxin reductase [Alcanivorax sp.]
MIRRLGKALSTPFDPEDYLALFDPLQSAREVRARVIGVHRESDQAVTLTLQPNRLWKGHRAGQHVLLGVEIDGVRHQRCFSLSSAPGEAPTLSVKRQGEGGVSDHLVNRCRAGDLLTLAEPSGDFVLPEAVPERLLMVTAGSGITPVHSIVKSLLASNFDGKVVWAHFERRYQDLILSESLAELRRDPRLDLRLVVTGDTPRDGDQAGRLDEHWLTDNVDAAAEHTVFTCGPTGFLDTVMAWHGEHGLVPLFHERFKAATVVAGEGGRLHFARTGGQAEAAAGVSLLEAAEQAGLKPKHGCRMGICHTCKCRVAKGRVRDLQSGESRELNNQEVRICVHAAEGDVELDL